jgi:mevalonate kinase
MVPKLMKISLGGKSIFTGEYSLLHEGAGVSALFDELIHFKIGFNLAQKDDVLIHSDRFGESSFSLDSPVKKEFQLFQRVLSILKLKKVTIQIQTTSSFTGGFGTSGACIVAMCCFYLFHKGIHSKDWQDKLFSTSIQIQKNIYPQSSGMDIANEIYGGILYYQPQNLIIKVLDPSILDLYKIIAVNCGYKTPTEQCIEIINKKHSIEIQKKIFEKISSCTQQIKKAFAEKNHNKFEFFMKQNNDLLIELGVCDSRMTDIIQSLQKNHARIVKISGSGLGDYILGFFDKNQDLKFLEDDLSLNSYQWKEIKFLKKGIDIDYE